MKLWWVGLAALAALAGCRGDRQAANEAPAAAARDDKDKATVAPADDGDEPLCDLPEIPLRMAAADRVVAIGDVHGDLQATREVLRLAGAIDEEDRWIGGKLVVVQTGDVLDRGDGERAIVDMFRRLATEAAATGGAFVALNGNHELMNAVGDFRYVTEGGYRDFADITAKGLDDVPAAARGRVAAFEPGGPYARKLAEQNVAVIVGDTAFVHGGIEPPFAGRLARINLAARCFLSGKARRVPDFVAADDGPVWSRTFGIDPVPCSRLDESLKTMGVSRMVVGHTVNTEGITSACDDKVWRIDVGIASYYGGPRQALEIAGDRVHVLDARRPAAP